MTRDELIQKYVYSPEEGVFRSIRTGKQVGYKCKTSGYTIIQVGGKKERAHRLAFFYMTGRWPKVTDHINRVKDDNRWENLREVTQLENCHNRSLNKNNLSGYRGVSFDQVNLYWLANFRYNGKPVLSRKFDCRHRAAIAVNRAMIKQGLTENLNIIKP